jgi:hypothetical protein
VQQAGSRQVCIDIKRFSNFYGHRDKIRGNYREIETEDIKI